MSSGAVFTAIAAMVMVGVLLLTLSRSALAGLGAAALVGWWLGRPRLRFERTSVPAMLGLLGAVVLMLVLFVDVDGWATRVGQSFDIGPTRFSRITIWRESLPIIGDFWLTGTGAGTYSDAMTVYQQTRVWVGSMQHWAHFNNAHSYYIQVASEGGLLRRRAGAVGAARPSRCWGGARFAPIKAKCSGCASAPPPAWPAWPCKASGKSRWSCRPTPCSPGMLAGLLLYQRDATAPIGSNDTDPASPDTDAARENGALAMLIVGLNAYHGDVAAAVLRDGQLVAALEEERFARVKHVAGFPARAIARGLDMAGATPADVDIWAIARGRRVHLLAKGAVRAHPSARRGAWSASTATPPARAPTFPSVIAETFGLAAGDVDARARYHRASSGASRERVLHQRHEPTPRAARLTASATSSACRLREGRAGRMNVIDRVFFPHSLGHAVSRDHAVPRLQEIRRRIQGDGSGAVRQAGAHRRRSNSSSSSTAADGFVSTSITSVTGPAKCR